MRLMVALAAVLLGPTLAAAQESDRDAAIRLARKTLADEQKVPASSIAVDEVEATEWTDGNLGCPGERAKDAPAGAAALVPGWRIVLSVAGRTHELHVGADRAVRCQDGPKIARPPAEARGRIVDRVRADLASRLGIPVSQVKLKANRSAKWPDQSLGCPRPGETYAQVVTEGQSLEFEAAGRIHRYHTAGNRFVYCPDDEAK